jgi:allantoinase
LRELVEAKMSEPFPYFPFRAIVDHPPVRWPNGARIAIWIVHNIEHFHLELPGPRPNVMRHSQREYGNRVGLWRVIEVMEKFGIPSTVALNGEVGAHYPRIMNELIRLDWELMGHGMTNSIHPAAQSLQEEADAITRTKTIIEQYGRNMKGWLGPGLSESPATLDLLKDAGVEYVADWVNDDLPYRMNNGLYSIPYSMHLNDFPLIHDSNIGNAEFLTRIRESFDVLFAEGAKSGRVLGIALHPFLIGMPSRIRILEQALAYMTSYEGVWFARGGEIITAYREQFP